MIKENIKKIKPTEGGDLKASFAELANKEGFEVYIIWDSEYKKNKEEVINKCINYLKN
jgi:hypothetical protein